MPPGDDTPAPRELARSVIDACLAAGFAAAGVCSLEPSAWQAEFHAWLGEGKHGSMAWLERHTDLRLHPGSMLEGAQSAVIVADLYASRAANTDTPLQPGQGRIARYARGRDYHEAIKQRLHDLCDALRQHHPSTEFRAFVDTAPVPERELAARAGLGWTGKHTLTIHPKLGSYLLLGGFFTTLPLEPPAGQAPVADHCGTCTRCIDACPTQAITPYSVDARRCISYLTIEHRAPIDPALHEGMGPWVFGCDICQEVCPHNSPREPDQLPPRGREANPLYAGERDRFDLLEVLGWAPEDRSRSLSGSAMKRATLAMWKRNAVIAAGNALREGNIPAVRERLESIAADPAEEPMVREAARSVMGTLPH